MLMSNLKTFEIVGYSYNLSVPIKTLVASTVAVRTATGKLQKWALSGLLLLSKFSTCSYQNDLGVPPKTLFKI